MTGVAPDPIARGTLVAVGAALLVGATTPLVRHFGMGVSSRVGVTARESLSASLLLNLEAAFTVTLARPF